jgi:acyl-CoA oxidase
LKSLAFGDCLKFAQQNRLCCGGHGYSASSGLGQIIQEADAGCTYEGDNIVLLLQTARYLLKCNQKGINPHLEMTNSTELKSSSLFKTRFETYFNIFYLLYEESVNELSSKMFRLLDEEKLAALDAWNRCSVQLTQTARVYIDIFVINSNLSCIQANPSEQNRNALADLFELYMLYELCEVYPGHVLRVRIFPNLF